MTSGRITLTHACPGCNKPSIPNAMFACPTCWFRLPASIRNAINDAYRRHGVGSVQLLAAHRAAENWYATNP